jgi:hypothetical protein
MAVVGLQIGQGDLAQGLVKFVVLATKLDLSGGIDVEKFAPTQALPGTRIIPTQHLLGMLTVQVHPGKEIMLGQQTRVVLTRNGNASARQV